MKTQHAESRPSQALLKQEKFGGKSKRDIEKSKTISKDRDDDKDDFDGKLGLGRLLDSGCEEADFSLDNDLDEQSERPVALFHKTTMFYGPNAGCENDCIIRSFLEICRRRYVYLFQWFRDYLYATIQRCMDFTI